MCGLPGGPIGTAFTLFVVPALYTVVARDRRAGSPGQTIDASINQNTSSN